MKNKLSVVRIISVIVASIGVIMLVVGLVLSLFLAGDKVKADETQMPEEYIEEFFSDGNENNASSDNVIEPEYKF